MLVVGIGGGGRYAQVLCFLEVPRSERQTSRSNASSGGTADDYIPGIDVHELTELPELGPCPRKRIRAPASSFHPRGRGLRAVGLPIQEQELLHHEIKRISALARHDPLRCVGLLKSVTVPLAFMFDTAKISGGPCTG